MGVSGIAIQPVSEGNFEASIQFLIEWVSGGDAEAFVGAVLGPCRCPLRDGNIRAEVTERSGSETPELLPADRRAEGGHGLQIVVSLAAW
jgi:hypothetical protein